MRYFHRDTYCIVASTVVNEQYAYLVDTGFICMIYSLCSLGGCAPPPHTPHVVFSHAYDLLNSHNRKRAQSSENGSKTIPQTESLGVSHGSFC